MLSKATSTCLFSLKSAHKAALSRILLPNTQLSAPAFPKITNFHNIPNFSFARIPDKEKQKSVKPKQEASQVEEGEDDTRSDFVNFMQKKPEESNVNYEFDNKTIFHVQSNPDEFTRRYLFYWGMGAVWFTVSYLTFNFINPWVAIIPCWFLAGSLVTIRMSARFAKTMIKKIELVDSEHIKIYPLAMKGKDVLCNIKDTEVLGIKMMAESPQHKDGNPIKSYLIMANFTEAAKKKSYAKMRLIVDPKLTTVPNIDLLKSILYGETSEVAKYRFVEKDEEEASKLEKEKIDRDTVVDAEGEAKFDFKEEEFEQFRRELRKEVKEDSTSQENENKK